MKVDQQPTLKSDEPFFLRYRIFLGGAEELTDDVIGWSELLKELCSVTQQDLQVVIEMLAALKADGCPRLLFDGSQIRAGLKKRFAGIKL